MLYQKRLAPAEGNDYGSNTIVLISFSGLLFHSPFSLRQEEPVGIGWGMTAADDCFGVAQLHGPQSSLLLCPVYSVSAICVYN